MNTLATREYKILVLGSTGVGKSAISLQFTKHMFNNSIEPLMDHCYRKPVRLFQKETLLNIIDLTFHELTALNKYILDSNGFLLIYDITSKSSFDDLKVFREKILEIKNSNEVPLVIVGNKIDLQEKREVSLANAKLLAQEWNCRSFEISARTKENIDIIFSQCVKEIQKEADKNHLVNSACCACSII